MALEQVNGIGSHARVQLFSAVASNSIDTVNHLDSSVLDLDGWPKVWIEVMTEGFDAASDLVGSLEFYHGVNGSTLGALVLMPLSTTEFAGAFPTGVTLDDANDQIDIAATLEANGVAALLCLKDIAPRLCARLRRASGGDADAKITVTAYLFR